MASSSVPRALLVCAAFVSLPAPAVAQPRVLPPARQYHATYSLSCRASGNDIVLRNDGPGAVPSGTGVHWSWWGREGDYGFAQPLSGGGHEVVIPHAFPPLPRPAPADTPCTLTVSPPMGLQNPGGVPPLLPQAPSTGQGASGRAPSVAGGPPAGGVAPVQASPTFSLTCQTRFDPQSRRLTIWVLNSGPVRVPIGTRLHWTLDFNQLHEEGNGIIGWPLPPGHGRSIAFVQHQYIPEGRPCSVEVAG